jgi:hypothetical protein
MEEYVKEVGSRLRQSPIFVTLLVGGIALALLGLLGGGVLSAAVVHVLGAVASVGALALVAVFYLTGYRA